jgi:hypothetical protein
MADLFCESSIPEYQQRECGAEFGGIIAVGFIDEDETINTDNVSATLELASWWTARVVTASPSTAWVVKNTRGSKAAGSPTEEEGFGLVATERTGADEEVNLEALWVMDNKNFWAKVNRTRNLKVVLITAGKDAGNDYNGFYISNCSIFASEIIDQSIKSRIRYAINIKWSSGLTPMHPFSAPASIFVD